MAFDLSTAKPEQQAQPQVQQPVSGGFDLSTAKPEVQEQAQPQEASIGESILGGISGAATLASSAVGAAIGTADVLVDLLNPFTDNPPEVAKKVIADAIEAFKISPNEGGALAVQKMAETLEPIVGPISEFIDKAAAQGMDLTGSNSVGTFLTILPDVIGVASGTGAAKGVTSAAAKSGKLIPGDQAISKVFDFESPTKAKIRVLLERGEANADTAGFRLKKPETGVGKAKVIKDKIEGEAINQGFDKGIVATIKGISKLDKDKLSKMVNILEKGKKNSKFAAVNRPSDVAGDTLMNRVRVINSAKTKAGKELDIVADSLKGQTANVDSAMQSFTNTMSDLGVKFTRDKKGKAVGDFSNSDIDGLTGPMSIINRVVNRLDTKKPLDANQLHRIKRFIDTQVSFGKNVEGLEGAAANSLKKLRRDIDTSLDNKFPEYNRVNTVYSDTVGALDSLQDIAGRKMDLSGPNAEKATGTLLRRVLGNAQSRVALLDSIENIESVAKRHGTIKKGVNSFDPKKSNAAVKGKTANTSNAELDSDLLTQILFADELDRVFGSSAKTSLSGDVEKAVGRAAQLIPIQSGAAGAAALVAQKGIDVARGVNEANAFKSINKLLNKGNK